MQLDPPCTALQLPVGLAVVPDWPDWRTAFRSKLALSWGSLLLGNPAEIQKIRSLFKSAISSPLPSSSGCLPNEQGQLVL